jgi:Flp pilus assembly protein TadD
VANEQKQMTAAQQEAQKAAADTGVALKLARAARAVDDAIATFGLVDAKSPSYLGATLGLERAELMLRRPMKALGYAQRAVKLSPNDKRAQIGHGVALDMLGRHVEAQPCYRRALAIDPADVAARSDLALSLAFTGKFDEAVSLLTPLARSPSATPRLRQNLALVYGLKGDKAAARALSRTDLPSQQAEANLKFFSLVHEKGK